MGYYNLSDSINQLTDDICNTYALNMFVYNPIIAAMIVTFITMAIYQYSKNKGDKIKIYIMSVFINTCYLFFHIEAMRRRLSPDKTKDSNMFISVRNEGDIDSNAGFIITND